MSVLKIMTTYDAIGNPLTCYLVSSSYRDIEKIYTSTGVLKARYYYDAYGVATSVKDATGAEITSLTNVANINPFRYRGYYYDAESGLYYLGSRYYDPATGRFINADGMVQTGQDINDKNMFAYCGNDPVNRADPSGSWWINAAGQLCYDAWEITGGTTVPSTVAAAQAQRGGDGTWHAPIKTPTIPKKHAFVHLKCSEE